MQILRQRQQQIVLNSSLNSNASNSANNSISISTNNTNNSSNAASVAGNLLLAHGQSTNNEPFSLLNPGILYSTDGIKQGKKAYNKFYISKIRQIQIIFFLNFNRINTNSTFEFIN